MAERSAHGGRPGTVRRTPVIVGVAALLAAGGLADRAGARSASTVVAPSVSEAAPVAALSSSWLCGGATAPGGAAAGSLAIANETGQAEVATITLVPNVGRPTTTATTVAAHAEAAVAEDVAAPASWVAAEVTVDGGGAAVSQTVSGPEGTSVTPCATSAAQSWWFPTGATLVNATDTISLFDPYGTDAIVDMSFTTDQGGEVPGDFQAIDVAPHALVTVDLGSHLRRRSRIATTVHARTGRIVAFSTTVVTPPSPGEAVVGGPVDPTNPTSADPAAPAAGVAVTAGAPATSTMLWWPGGDTGAGLDERYVVYNPGAATADLSLSVALDQGQAEPFTFQVAAGQVTTIDAGSEARIPPGVGHSATLRSTNGVGVVADRTLVGVAPSPETGTGAMPGEPVAATNWIVPDAAAAGVDSTLLVLPTGPHPVSVSVGAVGSGVGAALPGLGRVQVAPGTRAVLPLSSLAPGFSGAVVVHATGPVVVEDDAAAPGRLGLSLSPGTPLG